jgi:hypothetical protein
MKDKLTELKNKRAIKLKEYNGTSYESWRKKLYRLQLQAINTNIQIEQLKRKFQ